MTASLAKCLAAGSKPGECHKQCQAEGELKKQTAKVGKGAYTVLS